MLKIKNLIAGYGSFQVLNEINLEVNPGQIVCLIGPNGAGKSTVLKSIFNLAKVYSGEIKFNNLDITKLKAHQLVENGICYIPQSEGVFSNLTVLENLQIGNNKKFDKIFDLFTELKNKQKHLAKTLSGGQRQQLAFARALIFNPKLLLLDEPSIGLSPIYQKEIFKIIKKLSRKGIAIILVEHNVKAASQIADKTLLLENGKIVLSKKDILDNKKVKKAFLG